MRAPEIIILGIIAMLTIGSAFWIWMLIDCALNRAIREGPKTLWMIFILLTHWIGALIYFFTGRRLRTGPAGRHINLTLSHKYKNHIKDISTDTIHQHHLLMEAKCQP